MFEEKEKNISDLCHANVKHQQTRRVLQLPNKNLIRSDHEFGMGPS